MKRVSVYLLLLLTLLMLTSCSAMNNSTTTKKSFALAGLTKVTFAAASSVELGKNPKHQDYEVYVVDKAEDLRELENSIKSLTLTTDNPDNVAYTATLETTSGSPIEIWFGFPDKIWLKGPDGKMQCWAVEGEFANLVARHLKGVPTRYKGEIGINGITKQPVLFVFDKPYNLYMAPQDAAKLKDRLGEAAVIVGKHFINNNDDYIEVVFTEVLPSVKIKGNLLVWISGDLAIKADSGEYFLLRVNNIQKAALKELVNKRLKLTGVIQEPDNYYARKNISIYYYRIFMPTVTESDEPKG